MASVEVSVAGRQFRVRAEGDGETLRRAADLVEETLERVRGRSGTADTLDVALMAALNLANQVVGARAAKAELSPLHAERIDALTALLEETLAPASAS